MTQKFKGWTVGLIGPNERYGRYFLGRFKSQDGTWNAITYHDPCTYYVYANLFGTAEEALKFWETCDYTPYEGKAAFTPIPVEIEISVEVKGLGFGCAGIT